MSLQNVKEIFTEALDLPAEDRLAFVAARVGADRVTFEQVRTLLAAHAPGRKFFSRLESLLQAETAETRLAAPDEVLASRFRVIRFVAAGAMGEVYEAWDPELSVPVALKLLKPSLLSNAAALERFRDEIRIARGVNHPNVCRIFDLGSHQDSAGAPTLFYTMELLDGETVAAKVRRLGALPVADVLDIATQLAAGLEAIHTAQVLHRDISSGNIMLCRQPNGAARTVLMDFGLAVRADLVTESERGIRGGTVSYSAPEQLRGAIPSIASDVYAFGAVLFELMTGHPPKPGPAAPPRPSSLRPGLPKHWDAVILKCLQPRPSDRFSTVAATLQKLHGSGSKFARRWLLGAAATGIAAAATGLHFWQSRAPIPRQSVAVALFTTADPTLAYLASGLSSRLIDTLTEIPGLRVIGAPVQDKTLLADFAGLEQRARVGALLQGEVARNGDGYRIRIHLTDLESRYDLWSHSFEVNDRDLERLHQTVAQAAIRVLNVATAPGTPQPAATPLTPNPEACQAYLLGAYYAAKRDSASLALSISAYQRAVDLDPYFAHAFAGLAAALNLAAGKPLLPDFAKAAESTRFANHALSLNPKVAEAEAVLGYNEQRFNWNWQAAETHYRRAVELNRNSIVAHHWYSNLLSLTGRPNEALREIAVARQLDPLSPVLITAEGAFLTRANRLPEALDQMNWQIKTHPDYASAYIILATAQAADGQLDQALTTVERGSALTHDESFMVASRGYYLGRLGRSAEVNKLLDELLRREAAGKAAPSEVAEIYSGLHDAAGALLWLNRAYDRHDLNLTLLAVDPEYAWLRPDPRFHELSQKMHLPGPNNTQN